MIKVVRSPVSCASNVASSNCASLKVEEVCDRLEHAVASEGQITRLNRGANGRPSEIDRGRDRLRPDGNRSHSGVNFRVTCEEAVLLDQIAGEFGETVGIAVPVKDGSEKSCPKNIGLRG